MWHWKFFGLVNLILGSEVVPERVQEAANADELTKLLDRYITDSAFTESVVQQLKKLPEFLGEKGATSRVAKSIEAYL